MLASTKRINEAWAQDDRKINLKVKIGNDLYDNDTISSITFDSGSISGETFQIGTAFMGQITLTFPDIIESIDRDLDVTVELGILIEEEDEEDNHFEYTKLGKFIISDFNRDRNANTTTVTACDQMVLLEGTYESKLKYPTTIQDVALEIANLSGVHIDQTSFQLLSQAKIDEPKGYTYRQAIGLVAQFEGGYANFNREGNLQVKQLEPTEFTITPKEYLLKGFTKNESTFQINGIKVRIGDNEGDTLTAGNSNGNVIELENKVMTQTLLNKTWDKIKGINYFPFELKWRGNPNVEAGDWIYILDKEGNRYSLPNLSFSFTFNGGLSADSKATTSSNSETTYRYRGTLQQTIEKIQNVLQGANGWNHNWYGPEKPTNPKIGDLWFKENGKDVEIWIYELVDGEAKWVFKVSTAPNKELLEVVEEAIQRAEEAKKAGEEAEKAGQKAENAANVANEESQKATQKANDAFTAASGAVKLVDTAVKSVEEAKSDAKNARENALKALQDVEGLSGRVTKAETSISKNTEAITFKAAKTDLDATNKRVTATESSLSIQAGQIKTLNTQTDGLNTTVGSLTSKYNSLNSTIVEFKGDTANKFTTVNQTLTSIQSTVKDKASQSQVTQLSTLLNTTVSTVNGHTSSITQMAKDINLRVEKDKVINQINISTEGILIDGDNIWITGQTKIDNAVIGSGQIKDLAVTTAKIADLAVNSAKIKDLSASKLTSGTIDAKVINVLNLNASNMTTGTLNGANVNVINLNAASITSGTLNASLVRLMAQNGKKTVEITGSGFSTTDNNGTLRMVIGVRDLAGDGQSDPSNVVFYSGNGKNSTYIGTNVEDTFSIASASGNMRGFFSFPTGLILSSSQLRFGDPNTPNDYIEVRSTMDSYKEPMIFSSKPSSGVLGNSSYWWRQGYVTDMMTRYLEVGFGGSSPQEGDFKVYKDGAGAYIRSKAAYARTYSGAANMYITDIGTIGRTTSARKYKTDIQPLSLSRGTTDKRILYMQPVSWQDKAEIQHHGVSRRYYGYIADDFHDAGLTEVVQYGADGQVEGLSYDRLGIYTIPILREHEESLIQVNFALSEQERRIQELETEVQKLKNKLEEVA